MGCSKYVVDPRSLHKEMVDPREFAQRIEFKSWTSVFRMFATAEEKGVPHDLVTTIIPTFESLQVMSAFHATMQWLLSCWDFSAELVTAYQGDNFEEINSNDKNAVRQQSQQLTRRRGGGSSVVVVSASTIFVSYVGH